MKQLMYEAKVYIEEEQDRFTYAISLDNESIITTPGKLTIALAHIIQACFLEAEMIDKEFNCNGEAMKKMLEILKKNKTPDILRMNTYE